MKNIYEIKTCNNKIYSNLKIEQRYIEKWGKKINKILKNNKKKINKLYNQSVFFFSSI